MDTVIHGDCHIELKKIESHSIDLILTDPPYQVSDDKTHVQNQDNFYEIHFRPRQTRRQYHDLPRRGMGRVRYQVNAQLDGFRKGDIVRVKNRWVKQINSIYSSGHLAFARIKGEPSAVNPKDCLLLQRGQTMIWQNLYK